MPGRCTRGVILQISLDPARGHEIKKSRPCLVVQNDVGNKYSPMTVVVPIEGAEHVPKLYPVNVFIPAGEGSLSLCCSLNKPGKEISPCLRAGLWHQSGSRTARAWRPLRTPA